MKANIEGETDDEVMKEENLLCFVTEHEMVPNDVSLGGLEPSIRTFRPLTMTSTQARFALSLGSFLVVSWCESQVQCGRWYQVTFGVDDPSTTQL